MCRCGTQGHSLVGLGSVKFMVGLYLKVFSNLNDSMILF